MPGRPTPMPAGSVAGSVRRSDRKVATRRQERLKRRNRRGTTQETGRNRITQEYTKCHKPAKCDILRHFVTSVIATNGLQWTCGFASASATRDVGRSPRRRRASGCRGLRRGRGLPQSASRCDMCGMEVFVWRKLPKYRKPKGTASDVITCSRRRPYPCVGRFTHPAG